MESSSFFIDHFLNKDINEFKNADVKEIGIVVDWFSHVFGRTILVGTLSYESYKNYRCKKEFEKNVLANPINKPVVIFIHDWDGNSGQTVANKFGGSFDAIFNHSFDDIKDIETKFLFRIRPPRLKTNGKPHKHFNINRKKRFRIPVVDGLTSDMRVIGSTIISCTFRDLK